MKSDDAEGAVNELEQAQCFPENLGEGRLANAQQNHVDYYLGCAHSLLSNQSKSQEYFELASTGNTEPTSAIYYNDQPPDMIYYQGKGLEALGEDQQANEIFQRLIDYGTKHMEDEVTIDYFAVSLPDFLVFDEDLILNNHVHCHYMMALGHLGLEQFTQALSHFESVLKQDAYHSGATIHKAILLKELS